MLDISLGLYQKGSEYPGRSPIFLVCVTPELQWTRRYFPLEASLIFDRYFPLMNALNVKWFLRRPQFSLIPASYAASRMVFSTYIIMALHLLILSLIGYVCRTSWFEVWQNMTT